MRKGRLESVVNRDRFIREAVLQQRYLASQVAGYSCIQMAAMVSGKSRLPRIISFAFGSTYDAPIARKNLWS